MAKKPFKIPNSFFWAALILGGGYMAYKYFTPGKIANTVSKKIIEGTLNYTKKLPGEYWKREKVFNFSEDIKTNVKGAAQTEDFINLTGIITRVNPFTRPISPVIDYVFSETGKSINKYLGGV